MKSLRSTGMSTAARTSSRSASEPRNRRPSVSTEIADAPPAAYSAASSPGCWMSVRWPFDGDARLISAITGMPSSCLSHRLASRGAGAWAAMAFSSSSDVSRARACWSSSAPATSSSSTDNGPPSMSLPTCVTVRQVGYTSEALSCMVSRGGQYPTRARHGCGRAVFPSRAKNPGTDAKRGLMNT